MRPAVLFAVLLPLAAAFSFGGDELDANATDVGFRAFATAATPANSVCLAVIQIAATLVVPVAPASTIGLGFALNAKWVVTLESLAWPTTPDASGTTVEKKLSIVFPGTYKAAGANVATDPEVPALTRGSRKVILDKRVASVTAPIVVAATKIALIEICPSITSDIYIAGTRLAAAMPAGVPAGAQPTLVLTVPDPTLKGAKEATRTVAEECECDDEAKYKDASNKAAAYCIRPHADFLDSASKFFGAPMFDSAGKLVGLDAGPGGDAAKPEVGWKIFDADVTEFLKLAVTPAPITTG